MASCQLTLVTGCSVYLPLSFVLVFFRGFFCPLCFVKPSKALTVTAVFVIQKPGLMVTGCWGSSFLSQFRSIGTQPILKEPDGIHAYVSVSFTFTRQSPG